MMKTVLVVGLVATVLACAGCERDSDSPDLLTYDLTGAWGPSGPAECSGNLPEDDLRAIGQDILAALPLLITQTNSDLRIDIVGGAPMKGTLSGNQAHWQQGHKAADGLTVWSGIVLSEDRIALTQRTEATAVAGLRPRRLTYNLASSAVVDDLDAKRRQCLEPAKAGARPSRIQRRQ